ncbi:MAG: hypothetical protein K2L52_06370, partial [Clostridia bacterium]|nr:hypothetical protein [Clostridia bacterium]
MNSKTLRAKYLKFAILIISICFLIGAISACLPLNMSVPELKNNALNDTAMSITQNSTDGLGEFNNGYSYVYTDKTLVDKYRAGDPDTPYDISVVKVDATKGRGTQENPFVIASVDDWTRFAKNLDDGSIASYGSGKYFVLASDIDFDGKTFYPVRYFNGTFYGMGHSLQNISVEGTTGWVYWNGSAYVQILTSGTGAPFGYGVFCATKNATICDLIVENFSYKQMPATAPYSNRCNSNTGGIVGYAYGDDSFLNCHTNGEVYSTIGYGGTTTGISGLVGANSNTSSTYIYFYRCSSDLDITGSSSNAYQMHGGLLGDSSNGGIIYIYDCVANLRSSVPSSLHTSSSSAVSLVEMGTKLFMENFIGFVDVNSTITAGAGALFGSYTNASIQVVKNCYVEGLYGAEGGTKYSYYGIAGQTQVTVNNSTIGNINVVKPNDKTYWTSYAHTYANRLSGHTEYGVSSQMLAKANAFFGSNYSQIWDVDKIGGEYTPDKTPVRNYLMAFINFRNLNNGGNNEESVGLPDGEPYIVGDKLPDETSAVSAFTTYLNNKANANHVFKGWTDDPTGNSEPFTELPSGLFGDVTLYAVWGLPDSYVTSNIKTSLTSDKTLIEYDSVESITLTAKVTHTSPSSGSMTNPSVTYNFIQDGDNKTTSANVKSSGVLSVKTVKDSGKYTFKYRLTDGLEPLWYYDGTPSNSVDIKIEKGKLEHMTLKDFKISTSTIPYFGKKLEDI